MTPLKSFGSILGAMSQVSFEFTEVIKDESQRDGSPIVRLRLKNPLGSVLGRKITDNATNDQIQLEANDVEIVSIGKEALEKIDELIEQFNKSEGKEGEPVITWEQGKEGIAGKFESKKLKMDVSAALEVWVVAESLSVFGRKQRAARRQAQTSALMDKINDKKTKKEFQNVDTNAKPAVTAVANTEPTNPVKNGQPEVVETVGG